jgi:hypothetical protein
MKQIRGAALVVLALAATPAVAVAATPPQSDESQARDVVEQFCRLEALGAGLRSDSPASLAWDALTTGDEDGADERKSLVSGFKVDSVRRQDGKMLVRVVYHVVGRVEGMFELHPRDEDSAHTYEVVQTKAGWRVAMRTVDFMGHLSPVALLRYFEDDLLPSYKEGATKSADMREPLERLIGVIAPLKSLVKRLEVTGKRD